MLLLEATCPGHPNEYEVSQLKRGEKKAHLCGAKRRMYSLGLKGVMCWLTGNVRESVV